MNRWVRFLVLAGLAVSLVALPCRAAFAAGEERCRMGDCDEPQVGLKAPCCCAAPASPARSGDAPSTGRVDSGKDAVKRITADLDATPVLPTPRFMASVSVPSGQSSDPPELFLLHSVFLI